MELMSIATLIAGVALFRGLVVPMLERYQAWKQGPRELVALRNWRGVYVPDLAVKRGERAVAIAWVVFVLAALPIAIVMCGGPDLLAIGSAKLSAG
jgi:hypothetical protein